MQTQKEFLSNLCASNPDAVIVGSLGTISTDLASIEHKRKILVKGAMGCALGVGLGFAMHSPYEVIVVIGDGSYLMKMGSMSTIVNSGVKNLEVHIINNNSYRSCGGQSTNFSAVHKHAYRLHIHEILT